MKKEFIGVDLAKTDHASALPFVLGVRLDNLVFLSGMVSKDLTTGEYVAGTIEEETIQVFENIKTLLERAGSSMDKILKTTVFLTDIKDFDKMNRVYKSYFPVAESLACRSTVEAKLVGRFKIEIEAIAYV